MVQNKKGLPDSPGKPSSISPPTNLNTSSEFLCEDAKVNFQHNVNSLLELRGVLRDKLTNATNPSAVFFDARELNVLDEWLTDISTNLMTDYGIICRLNKVINSNNQVLRQLAQRRTPNLNDLLRA